MKAGKSRTFVRLTLVLALLLGLCLLALLSNNLAMAADTPAWTQLTGGPDNQEITALAWDGSGLYAAVSGGDVWHYDVATHAWSDTGGLKGSRVSQLAWGGSELYAGTGGQGVWRYNPKAGSWTDTGGISGYNISSLAWDGSGLYAACSFTQMPLTAYYNGILRYDPATGAWNWVLFEFTVKYPRGYQLAWGGSSLYACAGLIDVFRYDPASGAWSDTGGQAMCLAWDGSRIYSTSGSNLNRYDPSNGSWTSLSFLPGNHSINALAWCGSGLYAIAYDNATYKAGGMWRYDPAAGTWTDLSQASLSFTCMACTGSSLNAGTQYNGVWRLGPEVAPQLSVTSISPASGMDINAGFTATLNGTVFQTGAMVRLENTSAGKVINATNVKVVSSTEITCTFDLTGAPLVKYDVVVKNPDNQEAKLAGGFTVTNICGQGAGISLVAFGFMLGLLSLAGSGISRRRRRKNTAA